MTHPIQRVRRLRARLRRLATHLALVLPVLEGGCWSAKYLGQQGLGQLRLLRARRRVPEVLADPGVDARTKQRLRLAWEARQFGVQVLGLRDGDAFTRYLELHGAPVAWNVSAAPRDRLQSHLWRFPITGAVPYLGFFREADARREQARLEAADLDTYVRGVAGYSTLGFTADPIYSSMLDGTDPDVVEVVLHEMLHGTVYLPGHSGWNESLATFVGLQGAAMFFRARGDPESARQLFDEAAARERDAARFSAFLEPVAKELEALYARDLPRADKLRLREEVFARAKARYIELFPPPPGKKPGGFVRGPLNNAVVMAYAVYHRDTPDHERLYERLGRDLPRLVATCKHAVEHHGEDPIGYLKGL